MYQSRVFDTFEIPVQDLVSSTVDWFRREGFDVNVYNDYNNRTIVQAYQTGFVRSIFGLASALTVSFTPQSNNQVMISLGGEIWGDKIVAGAVGAFFFFPLLITASVGAWQQGALDDKVYQQLGYYIQNRSGRVPNAYFVPEYSPWSYGAYPQTQGYPTANGAPMAAWPSAVSPTPPTAAQRTNWFDAASVEPIFRSNITHMSSWQAAMADGIIQPNEVNAQADVVSRLQKEAEDALDTEQRIKLAEILSEMDRLEKQPV